MLNNSAFRTKRKVHRNILGILIDWNLTYRAFINAKLRYLHLNSTLKKAKNIKLSRVVSDKMRVEAELSGVGKTL